MSVVRAYILISAQPGSALKVSANLRGLPGVVTTDAMAGQYDVMAVCEGLDINSIGSLVMDGIQKTDGVLKTVTCVVLPSSIDQERGVSVEQLGKRKFLGWTRNYVPDTERLRTMPEHVRRLWADRSSKEFSPYGALVSTVFTLASLLSPYQILVWVVGGIAHVRGGARPTILLKQLWCADFYVFGWLVALLILLGYRPMALWGFGPWLAAWRVVEILSINLRISVLDAPRLGWRIVNPTRSLVFIVTNVVELVVAFAVIFTALASQSGHFKDLATTIKPWDAVYVSATTMFTLGAGLTPLDDTGRYFIIAILGCGLIMIAIVIAGVVGSVAGGSPRSS